jgi:hypothetical protein
MSLEDNMKLSKNTNTVSLNSNLNQEMLSKLFVGYTDDVRVKTKNLEVMLDIIDCCQDDEDLDDIVEIFNARTKGSIPSKLKIYLPFPGGFGKFWEAVRAKKAQIYVDGGGVINNSVEADANMQDLFRRIEEDVNTAISYFKETYSGPMNSGGKTPILPKGGFKAFWDKVREVKAANKDVEPKKQDNDLINKFLKAS